MNVSASDFFKQQSSGLFSLGTRNTVSVFNGSHHGSPGIGIGGQFRIQVNDRLSTEWYADWITSSVGKYISRNDYHIGWSVMFYPGKQLYFESPLQPYIIIGHCFDRSILFEKKDKANSSDRLSMATQAGLGCHLNITKELDLSLSAQYMLHFGKELEYSDTEGIVKFNSEDYSVPSGHLLITLSANYKFGKLWKS